MPTIPALVNKIIPIIHPNKYETLAFVNVSDKAILEKIPINPKRILNPGFVWEEIAIIAEINAERTMPPIISATASLNPISPLFIFLKIPFLV